jgi:hypothetical protein
MKSLGVFGILALIFGTSAGANEILGQMSMYCTAKNSRQYVVAVYSDLKSTAPGSVYVTTPLGFVGKGVETILNNHLIVDVPVLSGKSGTETLDVDLSTNHCKPSGKLKDNKGNSIDLDCVNNDSSC